MGWNTSVLIYNDQLSSVEDPEFGKRLASAIRQMGGAPTKSIDIVGGIVIESHHADHCVPILVGGNNAWLIEKCFVRWSAADSEMQLLRALAEKHGFDLAVKKDKKRAP